VGAAPVGRVLPDIGQATAATRGGAGRSPDRGNAAAGPVHEASRSRERSPRTGTSGPLGRIITVMDYSRHDPATAAARAAAGSRWRRSRTPAAVHSTVSDVRRE
jgi:hypothetical protein